MSDVGVRWPSNADAWRLTLGLTFAYTVAFLHRICLSLFVEPLRHDFVLTDTQVGLLTGAAFAIPYTLSGPIAGWLVDRRDRRRLLTWAAVIWSAATGMGVFSYGAMIIARLVTGVGQSVVQPASASLIADVFPPERRAAGYGVFVAGTAFGTAGAYLAGALAVVLGHNWAQALGLRDWQAALLVIALLGLLVPPVILTNYEPVRRELATGDAETAHVLRFFHRRAWVFMALFGGVTLSFLAPYGQLAFMPSLFIRKYAWSAELIAVRFGLIAAVVGAVGSLGSGWFATRLTRRGVRHASWLVCLIGAVACLVPGALAPLMPTGDLALLLFACSGMFANWSAVAVLAVIAEITPNELRGQVTAIYTSCVGLFAAALGPLAVGMLNDHLPGGGSAIDLSLSLTFGGCALGAGLLLAAGIPAFKRLRWAAATAAQSS